MTEWNPQDIRNALDLELIGEEGKERPNLQSITTDKFVQAAPIAAERIIYLALHSESESLSLRAATYITDRALGKPDNDGANAKDGKTELEKFAENIRFQAKSEN